MLFLLLLVTCHSSPVTAQGIAHGWLSGYDPTNGGGLAMNLASGKANCKGSLVTYAGGSVTLTASVLNFVYLDPNNNCAPAVETGTFSSGQILIASATPGASSYSSYTDLRSGTATPGCVIDSTGNLDCSPQGGQTFIPGIVFTVKVNASSATPTFDSSTGTVQYMKLTANLTSMTITSAQTGSFLIIALKQDATGSRSITWASNIDWSGNGGSPVTTRTAANAYTRAGFIYDGTNWVNVF